MNAALPQRQRRKDARPQELLDAALSLFVEKGFAATRSEEVALRAGVSKGTLYLYYPSKEDLLKEVVRRNVVQEIAQGAEFVRSHQGPTAQLLAELLDLWWVRFGQTPAAGIVKLMMSEARNFPEIAQFYVSEVIQPFHDLVAAMVQRGIERGEFRAVDVSATVHVLVSPLLFMAMNRHSLAACTAIVGADPQALIAQQVDLLLHGILMRPTAAPFHQDLS